MFERNGRKRSRVATLVLTTHLILGPILLWACAGTPRDPAREYTAEGPIVARIGERTVHQRELDDWIKDDWFSSQVGEDPVEGFELRSAGIRGFIDDYLVETAAAGAGLSFNAYLDREVLALGPVSDEEIDLFYERNKNKIQSPGGLEDLRPALRRFLEDDRAAKIVGNLREGASIEILLKAPRSIIPEGGASRGPANAPITLVEFSDYECPFCRKAEPTLDELARLYPTELRIVYRHLPLQNHRYAVPAAKAAICAQDQGKFWPYHRLLFANQQALMPKDLNAYAERIGIEMPVFASCLEDEATADRLARDAEAGRRAGARATPTFFINGLRLRGARELDAFRQIINRELGRGV